MLEVKSCCSYMNKLYYFLLSCMHIFDILSYESEEMKSIEWSESKPHISNPFLHMIAFFCGIFLYLSYFPNDIYSLASFHLYKSYMSCIGNILDDCYILTQYPYWCVWKMIGSFSNVNLNYECEFYNLFGLLKYK